MGSSLKWQKELPLIQRSLKLFIPALGKSQLIIWRGLVEWHTRIRMDDVDYLVEDNAMDNLLVTGNGGDPW